ncbi:hypothetical protein LCGC14_1937490 [marine sediment metagenome]|uniref:Uncharacterized protein n=1 Tax=marine sediment metagenome TaxID=412755 RepID=A0A0F9FL70_9ZZZZ
MGIAGLLAQVLALTSQFPVHIVNDIPHQKRITQKDTKGNFNSSYPKGPPSKIFVKTFRDFHCGGFLTMITGTAILKICKRRSRTTFAPLWDQGPCPS